MSRRLPGVRSAMRPRQVYLVCTAGYPNYGDEIILKRMLAYLAAFEPRTQVWVDCPFPGQAAALMRDVHKRARFTDTLFRLCNADPKRTPAQVAEFAASAIDTPGHAPGWVAGIEVFRQSDIVHLIGGGYLAGVFPQHIGLVAAAGYLADRRLARVSMTGVGLMPPADGVESVWRESLENFELVSVRDSASLEFLQSIGVRQAACHPDDIFFGGIDGLLDKRAHGAPKVMVCVQQDLSEIAFDQVVGFVRDAIATVGVPSEQVGFVECIPGGDREIHTRLMGDLPNSRVFTFWDIMRHGFPAAPHQQWISTRFHPHLVAAAVGASGIALNINEKYYGVKHSAVLEYGSAWSVASPTESVPEFGGPGSLPASVAEYDAAARANIARIYR